MRRPLAETLPAPLRADLRHLRAIEVGFGAGPSFVGGKVQRYAPPVPAARALAWLERYRDTFRRGHVALADGRTLFFDPIGFRDVVP